MEKTYTFEKTYFMLDVVAVGAFCALLAVWAAAGLLGAFAFPALLLWFVLVGSAYQLWNTFVSLANPRTVTVGDDFVAFGAFGREDLFPFDAVDGFNIREIGGRSKLFVRVNGGGPLKGRYWIQADRMSDGPELCDRLLALEERFEPDSLKARARRSSIAYRENEGKIKERIAADKDRRKKAQKRASKRAAK